MTARQPDLLRTRIGYAYDPGSAPLLTIEPGATAAGTRERLLRAAADVFGRRGYDGARVADIAGAAGLRCWSGTASAARATRLPRQG